MVWDKNGPQGFESAKIASIAVPYLQGKGLDLGCGRDKVWPSAIGVDNCKDYGNQRPPSVDVIAESTDLSMFSDKSMDYVFSSHNLEHIVDYKAALMEWWRVIKPKGYLILYLPSKNLYPNIGQDGANTDHKHDFVQDDIINAMKEIGSWELLENEERSQAQEYSFYQVYRKKEGKNRHIFKVWERNPGGKKRAFVCRFGAIGDHIMAASILPALKKQGYHITYNTSERGMEVLKHDPNIDEFWFQATDFVPNASLGPYWQAIAFEKRYDKIINLCESIEGGLLALPGRLQHDYPDEARKKMFSTVNYLERTHDIADVPYEFAAKFHPTNEEREWAKKERASIKGPLVMWAINGSAHHKVYPWVHIVSTWLTQKTPAHVMLMSDGDIGKQLQDGIFESLKKSDVDTSKIHGRAGTYKLREALTLAQYADCVVGPETGILNSVGLEAVPKVIYLSHSSEENLTKHWEKTTSLVPSSEDCPCFPCNRLHYNWDFCPQVEATKASLCASSIKPERVFEAILKALNFKKMEKPDPHRPDGTNSMKRAA